MASVARALQNDLHNAQLKAGRCFVSVRENGTLMERLRSLVATTGGRLRPKGHSKDPDHNRRLIFTNQHGSAALPLSPPSAAFTYVLVKGACIHSGDKQTTSATLDDSLFSYLQRNAPETSKAVAGWTYFDTTAGFDLLYRPQAHRFDGEQLQMAVDGHPPLLLPVAAEHVDAWKHLFQKLQLPSWELDIGKAPQAAEVDF